MSDPTANSNDPAAVVEQVPSAAPATPPAPIPAAETPSVESAPSPAVPVPLTTLPVVPASALPVGVMRFKRVRGRLTGIRIENYRAFRGSFELQLPRGENALLYGENGAGKSSLYHSVRDFLEAPQTEFLERDKPGAEGKKRELRLADNQHRPKQAIRRLSWNLSMANSFGIWPKMAQEKPVRGTRLLRQQTKPKGFWIIARCFASIISRVKMADGSTCSI